MSISELSPPYFGFGPEVPPDPILSLAAEFENDSRPNKLNLSIGYLYDPEGKIWTPPAIREAKSRFDNENIVYAYQGPTAPWEWLGHQRYVEQSIRLVFGEHADELIHNGKIAAWGTPGGTNAVSLAAEALAERSPDSRILMSDPTWPNHISIFRSLGLPIITYPHLHSHAYDQDAHLEAIHQSPPNTVVLFHTGEAHNPTGTNPKNSDDWRALAQAMKGRRALFDTAYAGLVDGLEVDTQAIRIFMEEGVPLAAIISYSKNAGLYGLRTGVLMVPASSRKATLDMQRHLNDIARRHYSTPPMEGEWIVGEALSDTQLRSEWNEQLAIAAHDLRLRRWNAVEGLGPDFGFLSNQAGLFSKLGITPEQTQQLRTEHAVYMAGDRVNIGGLLPRHIDQFVTAVQAVLQ